MTAVVLLESDHVCELLLYEGTSVVSSKARVWRDVRGDQYSTLLFKDAKVLIEIM